jgi:hypothetical protein
VCKSHNDCHRASFAAVAGAPAGLTIDELHNIPFLSRRHARLLAELRSTTTSNCMAQEGARAGGRRDLNGVNLAQI